MRTLRQTGIKGNSKILAEFTFPKEMLPRDVHNDVTPILPFVSYPENRLLESRSSGSGHELISVGFRGDRKTRNTLVSVFISESLSLSGTSRSVLVMERLRRKTTNLTELGTVPSSRRVVVKRLATCCPLKTAAVSIPTELAARLRASLVPKSLEEEHPPKEDATPMIESWEDLESDEARLPELAAPCPDEEGEAAVQRLVVSPRGEDDNESLSLVEDFPVVLVDWVTASRVLDLAWDMERCDLQAAFSRDALTMVRRGEVSSVV
jgi:hypothetical protein